MFSRSWCAIAPLVSRCGRTQLASFDMNSTYIYILFCASQTDNIIIIISKFSPMFSSTTLNNNNTRNDIEPGSVIITCIRHLDLIVRSFCPGACSRSNNNFQMNIMLHTKYEWNISFENKCIFYFKTIFEIYVCILCQTCNEANVFVKLCIYV